MKVLVVALDDQIREALSVQFQARNREYQCVGLEWLNISSDIDCDVPQRSIPADIGIVVNAISLECIDLQADDSLIDDLALLAQVCDQSSIPLIQLSNSQVFDGLESGCHTEDEEVVPNSHRGVLLCRMEELVRGLCHRHIILRLGPIFSHRENNILTDILMILKAGENCSVSNTHKSSPINAADLARVISAIIDQLECDCDAWGTYHYCSSDTISHYVFAQAVWSAASTYIELDSQLLLTEKGDLNEGWFRPLLSCKNIFHTFGIRQLPWRKSIPSTIKSVLEKEQLEIS